MLTCCGCTIIIRYGTSQLFLCSLIGWTFEPESRMTASSTRCIFTINTLQFRKVSFIFKGTTFRWVITSTMSTHSWVMTVFFVVAELLAVVAAFYVEAIINSARANPDVYTISITLDGISYFTTYTNNCMVLACLSVLLSE